MVESSWPLLYIAHKSCIVIITTNKEKQSKGMTAQSLRRGMGKKGTIHLALSVKDWSLITRKRGFTKLENCMSDTLCAHPPPPPQDGVKPFTPPF